MITKHVSIEWAESPGPGLRKFGFVFPIALKDVRSNDNIEDIIVAQHKGLRVTKVKPSEIKQILEGETDHRVLLIMDGYDQYKRGTNVDIDSVIERESLWDCCVIVTSRNTEELRDVRSHIDCEVEIHGFDDESVAEYVKKCLARKKDVDDVLKLITKLSMQNRYGPDSDDDDNDSEVNSMDGQDSQADLCTNGKGFGILSIPVFLNILCSLYTGKSKPSCTQKAKLVQTLVERYLDRESITVKGKKADKQILVKLEKLAWDGLADPEGQRKTFSKVSYFQDIYFSLHVMQMFYIRTYTFSYMLVQRHCIKCFVDRAVFNNKLYCLSIFSCCRFQLLTKIPFSCVSFQEEVIQKCGKNALTSGLLVTDESSIDGESEMFCFYHEIFQFLVAAKHLASLPTEDKQIAKVMMESSIFCLIEFGEIQKFSRLILAEQAGQSTNICRAHRDGGNSQGGTRHSLPPARRRGSFNSND